MRWLLLGLVLAVVGSPRVGRAQSEGGALVEARRLKAELRYEAARVALDRALRGGTSGPDAVAEIYQLLGEVTAGLGDPTAAEAYFARLLTLRPDFGLAPGASPKLTGPLEAARARAGALVLAHRIDQHRVSLVVTRDRLGMVAGARARYVRQGAEPQVVEARGRGVIELALAGRGRVRVELAAIDEYGNALHIAGELTAGPPPSRSPSRSLLGRWQLWGGIGVALAATGTGFGLAARGAERDLAALNERARQERFVIDFSEAESIRSRAKRYALVSNVAFAGTAAVGVTAAVLLVRELRAPSEEQRLTISPAWRSGAIGVAVGGVF
ncbi:MAG TPA: hypothetical protein VML75_05520 [Kofleriaceae bacterium]|nr:hypothetical protein [Kofleriaceae bacterium]